MSNYTLANTNRYNLWSIKYVAVYGTLREGYHNHCLTEGLSLVGTGTVRGFDMFTMNSTGSDVFSHIPFVSPSEDDAAAITVEIYTTDEVYTECWSDIMDSLDHLEGHPTWYQRVAVQARLDGSTEEIMVWMYMFDDAMRDEYQADDHANYVPTGDWANPVAEAA